MQVNSSLHCPGVAIAGLASTAEGVLAGDYWDYIPLSETQVALMIADVSGHGPSANVVALRVRAILRSALSKGLTLTEAVELAAESTKNDESFVTALLILVDVETNELHWLNAGHPPGIGITMTKTFSVSRQLVPSSLPLVVSGRFARIPSRRETLSLV